VSPVGITIEERDMYPKDEYGSYTVINCWISAWHHPYPGFTLNECRVYEDGSTRVRKKGPVYIAEHPEMASMYEVFMKAQGELMTFFDAE
jgi:hypothetical protein